MTGPLVSSIIFNSVSSPYSYAAYSMADDPPLFPVAHMGALFDALTFELMIAGWLKTQSATVA